MSEQFPLFRLATLLARQLSAPVAARIKAYARRHPAFRREVCARLGRAQRAADARCRLWALRLPQPRAPPPLSEAAALDAGADLLGELLIFSLGAAIVVFEVNRQAANQETKVSVAGTAGRAHVSPPAVTRSVAQRLAKVSARLAVRLQLEELVEELRRQERDVERLQAALQAAVQARDRRREGAPRDEER